MNRNEHGFSVIELIVVAGLMALIATLGVGAYKVAQTRNNVEIAAVTVAQTMRRAQALAQGMDGDQVWGVRITSSGVTIFQGTSYATRITSRDEIYALSGKLTVTGTSEFTFAKMTGLPTLAGSVTVQGQQNATKTITISTVGMVSY